MPISNPADVGGLAKAASGTYAGDNSANRAIAHGMGKVPKLVQLLFAGAKYLMLKPGAITGTSEWAVTSWDATNFYVGNVGNYANSANGVGQTYHWAAIG